MKVFLILNLLFFIKFLAPSVAYTQDINPTYHYKDKIILKTNQILFGQLINYSQDSIVLEMKSGSQVKFLTSQLKSVFQYTPKLNFRTNSWHSIAIGNGLIFGKNKEEIENTYGIEISILYKYFKENGHVFMGGLGIETYNFDLPYLYLPIMLGYEYHLPLNTNHSFYFGLRAGYTFMSIDESFGSSESKAGWLMNPTIGVLFKINSRLGFFAETGLKFQQANHLFGTRWWQISEEDQFNSRYLLRLGIIF
jgi:hypothetical protein